MTLRQRHTEGAILYEKKLKPFMKNMNDGKGIDVSVFLCNRVTV